MSYTYYTKEDDDLIIKNFPTMKQGIHTLFPDRSRESVMARAKRLGFVIEGRLYAWTDEEDEILRKYYPSMGKRAVEHLPGRTEGGVISRAKTLKIRKSSDWTKDEDLIIRHHGFKYTDELRSLLPGRTEAAIRARLQMLMNRRLGEIQYPLNLYMVIFDTHNGYDKWYAEFLYQVDKVHEAISNNGINSKMGKRINAALKYHYEDYMDFEEIALEMHVSAEAAEDLVKRGLTLMRYFIKKKY